jgi:hypothetical protein
MEHLGEIGTEAEQCCASVGIVVVEILGASRRSVDHSRPPSADHQTS